MKKEAKKNRWTREESNEYTVSRKRWNRFKPSSVSLINDSSERVLCQGVNNLSKLSPLLFYSPHSKKWMKKDITLWKSGHVLGFLLREGHFLFLSSSFKVFDPASLPSVIRHAGGNCGGANASHLLIEIFEHYTYVMFRHLKKLPPTWVGRWKKWLLLEKVKHTLDIESLVDFGICFMFFFLPVYGWNCLYLFYCRRYF